jgi:hypothetical protein
MKGNFTLLTFTTRFTAASALLAGLLLLSTAHLQAQTAACSCEDYIYLNETNAANTIGTVHKFRVNVNGTFTEIFSSGTTPWYRGTDLPNPHGLGADLNGNLYVGAENSPTSDVRRLKCDGTLTPPSEFVIPDQPAFNISSIGNTIYTSQFGSVKAYNSCTGAFINQVCFAGAGDPRNWGFHIAADGTMYTVGKSNDLTATTPLALYRYTAADFGGSCVSPLIVSGANPMPAVGAAELPNNPQMGLWGITTDPSGNIYIVHSSVFTGNGAPDARAQILKYNAAGQFVAATPLDITNGDGGWYAAIGVVYSETTNSLYVSTNQNDDCVAAFNASTMTYSGTAVPPVPGSIAKGLVLRSECCPMPATSNVVNTLCNAVAGEKVFLQNALGGSCTGVICGGDWTPNPANTGFTFDACDNSITVTTPGACGTFTLAGSNTQCGAYGVTLNICTFNLNVTNGTACTGGTFDLSTLIVGSSGGTPSYHTSLADAQNDVNPLASSTVSPTGATNYYIRVESTVNGQTLYCAKEVTVTIKAPNCGTISTIGPN